MNIQQRVTGFVKICVSGDSAERFLNLCRNRKYRMWNIRKQNEQIVMCMNKDDFLDSREIVKKSDSRVAVVEKHGLPFFMHKISRKKVFTAGLILAALSMVLLLQHIWQINFEGNRAVTQEQLLDFLAEQEIHPGTGRHRIDTEELEAGIRAYFQEITWVSVSMKGTVLSVHVKENDFEQEFSSDKNDLTEYETGDLTADYSGTIVSMIVRNGVPMAAIGDTVELGDILVSCRVPVYDENAEIKSYQIVRPTAEAEIMTQTVYQDELMLSHQEKLYIGEPHTQYMLRFPDFNIIWTDRKKNSGMEEDVLAQQKDYHLLSGGIWLFGITKTERQFYQIMESRYTYEEAEAILQERFSKYLSGFSEKGVQIMSKNVNIIKNGYSMQLHADMEILIRMGNLTVKE